MLPLWVIGAIALLITLRRHKGQVDWTAGAPSATPPTKKPRGKGRGSAGRARDVSIGQLQKLDPDFSRAVFEDFLYALYAEAHAGRSAERKAELSAYLSSEAASALEKLHHGASAVEQIIIGAMDLSPISLTYPVGRDPRAEAEVTWEVNYSETGGGKTRSFYAKERWSLSRRAAARSRAPELARSFHCPSCAAPLGEVRGNTCSHCGQQVDTGEFDWIVTELAVLQRIERPPILTTEVAEQGTDFATIVDPGRDAALQTLAERDPAFLEKAFLARVKLIFGELQVAWSERDWTRARPFVSDALFQMERAYVEAYRAARLRNITESARIERCTIVKAATDRYYDAITVRLFAVSLDYTLADDGGRLVTGSRDTPRRYSEYWTLIRGVGATGAARVDKLCPNCGAALKVNQAGSCEYCDARITSGRFDWVLSRIEQDEVYSG
jgi:hypothetical protein